MTITGHRLQARPRALSALLFLIFVATLLDRHYYPNIKKKILRLREVEELA